MSQKQDKKARKQVHQIIITVFEDQTMNIQGARPDINETLMLLRRAEDIIISRFMELAHQNGITKGMKKDKDKPRIITA